MKLKKEVSVDPRNHKSFILYPYILLSKSFQSTNFILFEDDTKIRKRMRFLKRFSPTVERGHKSNYNKINVLCLLTK